VMQARERISSWVESLCMGEGQSDQPLSSPGNALWYESDSWAKILVFLTKFSHLRLCSYFRYLRSVMRVLRSDSLIIAHNEKRIWSWAHYEMVTLQEKHSLGGAYIFVVMWGKDCESRYGVHRKGLGPWVVRSKVTEQRMRYDAQPQSPVGRNYPWNPCWPVRQRTEGGTESGVSTLGTEGFACDLQTGDTSKWLHFKFGKQGPAQRVK